MGLFDFIADVASAATKVVLTPVAIVADGVKIIKEENPSSTKKLLKSAADDLSDAVDEITPNF